jgi:TonB family protein
MDLWEAEMDSKEPMRDDELSALLRTWKVEGAPASLEARVFVARPRMIWWRPAAAVALALVMAAVASVWLWRPEPVVRVAQESTPGAAANPVVQESAPPAPASRAPLPKFKPRTTSPGQHEETHIDFSFGNAQAIPFAAKPEPQGGQLQFQLNPDVPLPPRVYRIGDGVTAPSVLQRLDPQYSDEGKMARLEGTCTVSLVVNENGQAQDVRITRPVGLGLDEKAVQAISQWKFKQGMKDGMPVAVAATIEVNFHLDAHSIWRPTRANFMTPQGATRPTLMEATYPADLGSNLNDSVAVQFDVDDNGVPINVRAQSPSGPRLETEAIAIVSGWRFQPGMKDGKPVSVPAAFDFAHGTTGASGAQLIRVGGNVQAANLTRKITPVYPAEAKVNGIQGVVRLGVRIDKDGHVSDVTVLSGDPTLTYAAVEAVKQWLYRPTLLNGSPVEVLTEVNVNFTLLQ